MSDQEAPDKPRLNDVPRLVTRLEGFLGRKSDGESGVKTIWLGMKEVDVAAKTMGKLRDRANAKNCVKRRALEPGTDRIEILWKQAKYFWRRFVGLKGIELLIEVKSLMKSFGTAFTINLLD